MLGSNFLMSRILVRILAISPPAGGARLSPGRAAEGALLAEQKMLCQMLPIIGRRSQSLDLYIYMLIL